MPLCNWNPDPAPFGNATGLDYVAADVKATIARSFGATVRTAGELLEETGRMLPAGIGSDVDDRHESDRKPREPFASITVSWDGLTVSGDDRDGGGYTRGYRSSYWFSRMDADTVVYDLRTIPEDTIVRYAVRGPMCDPSLPPGTVSKLGPIDDVLAGVADDYLREYGGLGATGNQERTS